jgi:hypothetical protein
MDTWAWYARLTISVQVVDFQAPAVRADRQSHAPTLTLPVFLGTYGAARPLPSRTLGNDGSEGEQMSQRAVERVLGRLATDEAFRDIFYTDAETALIPYATDLTPAEIDALRQVPRAALAAFSAHLDDRICRLSVPAANPEGPRP